MPVTTPLLQAGAPVAAPGRKWLVATAALASCLVLFAGNLGPSSTSPATLNLRAAASNNLEEHVFASGTWINPPESVETLLDGSIVATAVAGSDAWSRTSYGYTRLSASHLVGADLPAGRAIEVAFRGNFVNAFDQAGIFLDVKFPESSAAAEEVIWAKAGVELSDGVLQVGAVVTRGWSDWSVSPVPTWGSGTITIRVSRAGDAITVRARVDAEPFRLVRLAYLDPTTVVSAGPYLASPTKSGLRVNFLSWKTGPADATLHASLDN
ncbi:unnamed protein product [Aphanomyces euteiches]